MGIGREATQEHSGTAVAPEPTGTRGPPETAEVGWRKTAFFDRFLSFDVQLSQERGPGH